MVKNIEDFKSVNNHRKITAHLFWLMGGVTLGSMIRFESWLTTLSLLGMTVFFYAYSLLGDEFIKVEEKEEEAAK